MSKRQYIFLVLILIIGGGVAGRKFAPSDDQISASSSHKENPYLQRRANNFKKINKNKTSQTLNLTLLSKNKSNDLKRILEELMKDDSSRDWEKTLDTILKYTLSGQDRYESLLVFFYKWSEVDFAKAMEHAGKIPGYSYMIRSSLISHFAERDPRGLLSYYENNKNILNHYSFEFLGAIAENWAIREPDTALDWCLSLTENKSLALERFLGGIGYDSDETKYFINRIYDSQGELPDSIINQWATVNPDAAMEWAAQKGKTKE